MREAFVVGDSERERQADIGRSANVDIGVPRGVLQKDQDLGKSRSRGGGVVARKTQRLTDEQRDLASKWIYLPQYVVRKHFRTIPDHEKEEAVHVGEMELVESASRFIPEMGTKFQSYAKNNIWCVIKRWSVSRMKLREQMRTIILGDSATRFDGKFEVEDYRIRPMMGEIVELVDCIKVGMDSKWWQAISLSYGIADGVPRSHVEVASIMGVNRSVVGFFVNKGMEHMKKNASRMEISYDW